MDDFTYMYWIKIKRMDNDQGKQTVGLTIELRLSRREEEMRVGNEKKEDKIYSMVKNKLKKNNVKL